MTPEVVPSKLHEELAALINKHGIPYGSATSVDVLAAYLVDCIHSFNRAVLARDRGTR